MTTELARAVLDIDNLMGRYAYVSDHGFAADDYEPLWAVDSELAVGDGPPFVGRPAVLEFLASLATTVSWAFHQFSRETLDFADDLTRAAGTWSMFATNTTIGPDGPVPMLAVGRYRCEFTRSDSGWLFGRMTMQFEHVSNWQQSWVPGA